MHSRHPIPVGQIGPACTNWLIVTWSFKKGTINSTAIVTRRTRLSYFRVLRMFLWPPKMGSFNTPAPLLPDAVRVQRLIRCHRQNAVFINFSTPSMSSATSSLVGSLSLL